MNRFARFTCVSPLALYLESERRAWWCAGVLLAICTPLVLLALHCPAPGRASAGEGDARFCGVWLEDVSGEHEAAASPLIQMMPTLPPPEVVPEVPEAAAEVVVEWPEFASEWEAVEIASAEPLSFLELPEHLAAAIPPGRRKESQEPPARARSAEGELIPASYRSTPHPPYPPSLRSRRIQGRVGLLIEIDVEGVPREVAVASSSGYAEFDRCARDWVWAHWRFYPAQRGGVAVPSRVRTEVEFVLR